MRTLDTVLAWALVVLGIIHCAATVSIHPFGLGAVWFFSAGAAMIMAGLINVVRQRNPGQEFTRAVAIAANLLVVVMVVAVAALLWRRLAHNPQVIIGAVLSVGELLFSLRGRR